MTEAEIEARGAVNALVKTYVKKHQALIQEMFENLSTAEELSYLEANFESLVQAAMKAAKGKKK